LGAQSCLQLSLRTSISKKLHLGPQNGPRSENLLKIVNCQNGQKIVLSHLENVGGPRYPPGSVVPEICRPGDNMSARNRRKYVGPKFFFSGALPPNPRAGGPPPCTPPRGGLAAPPLTPLCARRRRSNTTTHAKNITHTQQYNDYHQLF
jgi:hypothetical protein